MSETLHDLNNLDQHSGKATASLVLGLVGIIAWFIPLFGYPVTITGLVLGVKGLKSKNRGMAIAGVTLSIIFLVITIINSIIGAIIASSLY
ncbi:MAG: DUF4190 domain-containing protein [Bacillaceae bacterium]|nr:DUF4190 domain-containing protein [Bacillaceae bacterium]